MYSDTDVLIAIETQTIKINPYEPKQLQTNSYDLRLGNTFYRVFWDTEGPFFVGPYVYLDGEKVDIPIGGTLLGMTGERVGTSGKVVAELRSRSTTRRISITTNCDAGLGDVGYNDYWTLELTAFVSDTIFQRVIKKFIALVDSRGYELYNNTKAGVSVIDWINRGITALKLRSMVLPQPFLRVGDIVAQMVFYECKSEPTKKYDGQYQVDWPLNMIPKKYRHRVIAP